MQAKKQQAQSQSRENAQTKRSQTAPYTQERSKAQYTEPKDTVIAKGTDNRAHAHTRQKGTGTVIGTATGH